MAEQPSWRHWFNLPAILIAGYWTVHWYFNVPTPGKALLALAFVASAMTLFETRTLYKMTYMLLIIALIATENRAINLDRSNAVAADTERHNEEKAAFQHIADGLTSSIRQNQDHFNTTMAGLNRDVNSVTGGDSFSYIVLTGTTDIGGYPVVIHKGDYPLYGVQASIWDTAKPFNPTLDNLYAGETILPIGDMPVNAGRGSFPLLRFGNNQADNFDISFSGHNGLWEELLRMRKVSGTWIFAIKVTRIRMGASGRYEPFTIFQQVDAKYPRVNGKVEWGN